jgi:putative ABC transport system substrate-binding protein
MWTAKNMLLETRFHRGTLAGIDQFASELVALKCDVILATAPYAIQAVMNATSTIPIVGIDLESDPVASGWVKSLARPGGNFTGLFLDIPELGGANRSNSSRKPSRQLRVWQFSGMRQ